MAVLLCFICSSLIPHFFSTFLPEMDALTPFFYFQPGDFFTPAQSARKPRGQNFWKNFAADPLCPPYADFQTLPFFFSSTCTYHARASHLRFPKFSHILPVVQDQGSTSFAPIAPVSQVALLLHSPVGLQLGRRKVLFFSPLRKLSGLACSPLFKPLHPLEHSMLLNPSFATKPFFDLSLCCAFMSPSGSPVPDTSASPFTDLLLNFFRLFSPPFFLHPRLGVCAHMHV